MHVSDNVKKYEVFQCETVWEENLGESFSVGFFFAWKGEVCPRGTMYNWQRSGETPGSVQDEWSEWIKKLFPPALLQK